MEEKINSGVTRTGETDIRLNLIDSFPIGAEDYACTWVYKNKNESARENYGICVNMYLFCKQPEEAFI